MLLISYLNLQGERKYTIYVCVCGIYIYFPGVALVVKHLLANTGDIRDMGSVHGSGRSPAGGHDNPLQYSCLESPMDKGTWWATVHTVAKS